MKFLNFVLVLFVLVSCDHPVDNKKNIMESIKYIDRKTGEVQTENVPGKGLIQWLYNSPGGNVALHVLFKRKIVSAIGGWYMDRKWSKKRIDKFITEHNIDRSEFLISNSSDFNTFNQFFYRSLRPDARAIEEKLVSPADGKIVVFPRIDELDSFFIKGSEFTVDRFLRDKDLTDKYKHGSMAIVRLAPPDYHRFHFPASGKISESQKINGYYFSVSPLALNKSLRIFCENKREYSILETTEFGDIVIVDVGATMVGSIIQTYLPGSLVKKGDEKGYFAFGGSTLVLLFEEAKICFDDDLISNTKRGMETTVRMGENIASPAKSRK